MMPNRQLGKYTILEELGRGGFGTVYRATDNVLDREVAIKLLHPQLMVEMNFAERFRKEAKLVARIEHSNIVTIYDLGEQEGRVYIAMRFLPGGSLRDRLNKSGRIPFGQALEILRQVGAGLSAAHAKGLIHRDIKPENILFGEAGQAVIADFGLAKAIQSSSSSSFGGLGTPGYRAPELWRGKPPAGQATDEYALACVFTEMLTGEHLFAGDTPDEIITKHLVDGPVFPKNWPEGVPQGISTVIEKALAKDPSERYQGVDGFIAALDDLEREKDKQKKELISQEMQKQAWKEAQEREQHAAEIVRLQLEIKTALVREEWLKAKQEIFELKNLGPEAIVAVQEETVGEVRALMLAARRLEEGGYLEEAIEIYHLAQELAVSDPTLGLLTNEVNSLLQNLDARRRKELLVRAIPFSSAQKDPFSPSQSAATEDNSSHNGKGWIWILVIVGLIVAGLIGLNISQRQAEEHRLATEVAQEYASQSTATKQAYASQSTATASSAQATLISQKSRGIIIFGPESGTITQDPNDNANAMFSSGVALKNFIAEVEMHNPYSTAENPWSYSIDFRETHTNYAFYLGIDSNANWTLSLDENGNWSTISQGHLYNLDTSVNGSNHIRLMMVDNVATFFLNNEFINTLDVSRNTMSGDVALVASTEIAGKTTPYSNFTVWELQPEAEGTAQAQVVATAQAVGTEQAYASQSTATASSAQATLISQKSRGTIVFGPESGTITQDPNDNASAMFSSGVALKNFIAEVEMHNPYSTAENPWSYSIDFRETHTNYAFYLGIDSNANWTLLLDDNGNWSTISHGYLYNLDTSVNGSNHIRLMMVDNVATFFLNNEFINTLDVSRNTMSGDVALVASTEIAGKTTPYSNFTVWAIP